MTNCAQAGPGRGTATGETRQSQTYQGEPRKSTGFRKIVPSKPDRRPPMPPAKTELQRTIPAGLADALGLMLLSLSSSACVLAPRQRQLAWGMAERLAGEFVGTKHGQEAAA